MEYLIKNILKRIEDFKQNGNRIVKDGIGKSDKNKKLNPEKQNPKSKRDNGGCC